MLSAAVMDGLTFNVADDDWGSYQKLQLRKAVKLSSLVEVTRVALSRLQ